MKLPKWLIRTKPDFTINELLVWLWIVGLTLALIPTLLGLCIGVASGFIVVSVGENEITNFRLKPWVKPLVKKLLRRSA